VRREAGGLRTGCVTGWVGCGVCWGMLSSGPAAQSGTAGYSEPPLARALSLTRVRMRVSGRRRRRWVGAAAAVHAGSGALGRRGSGWKPVKGVRQGPGLSATLGVWWCGQAGGPR
jgi:hypothetical protein